MSRDTDKGRPWRNCVGLMRRASAPSEWPGLGDGLNDVSMLRAVDTSHHRPQRPQRGHRAACSARCPRPQVTSSCGTRVMRRGGARPCWTAGASPSRRGGRRYSWGGHERTTEILRPEVLARLPRPRPRRHRRRHSELPERRDHRSRRPGRADRGWRSTLPGSAFRGPEFRRRIDRRHPRRRGEHERARCRRRAGVTSNAPHPAPQRPVSRTSGKGSASGPSSRAAELLGRRRAPRRGRDCAASRRVDPPPRRSGDVNQDSTTWRRIPPHKFDGTITNNVCTTGHAGRCHRAADPAADARRLRRVPCARAALPRPAGLGIRAWRGTASTSG